MNYGVEIQTSGWTSRIDKIIMSKRGCEILMALPSGLFKKQDEVSECVNDCSIYTKLHSTAQGRHAR